MKPLKKMTLAEIWGWSRCLPNQGDEIKAIIFELHRRCEEAEEFKKTVREICISLNEQCEKLKGG